MCFVIILKCSWRVSGEPLFMVFDTSNLHIPVVCPLFKNTACSLSCSIWHVAVHDTINFNTIYPYNVQRFVASQGFCFLAINVWFRALLHHRAMLSIFVRAHGIVHFLEARCGQPFISERLFDTPTTRVNTKHIDIFRPLYAPYSHSKSKHTFSRRSSLCSLITRLVRGMRDTNCRHRLLQVSCDQRHLIPRLQRLWSMLHWCPASPSAAAGFGFFVGRGRGAFVMYSKQVLEMRSAVVQKGAVRT